MAGKVQQVAPKSRWVDSIEHDLHSSGLDTFIAAQMVFHRRLLEAFC